MFFNFSLVVDTWRLQLQVALAQFEQLRQTSRTRSQRITSLCFSTRIFQNQNTYLRVFWLMTSIFTRWRASHYSYVGWIWETHNIILDFHWVVPCEIHDMCIFLCTLHTWAICTHSLLKVFERSMVSSNSYVQTRKSCPVAIPPATSFKPPKE